MGHAAAAGMGFLVIYFLAIAAFFIFWIKSLVEVIKNEYEGSNTKIMWLLLLVLMAPLGTILYQFIGKNQKI